jgi:hypothetical protein
LSGPEQGCFQHLLVFVNIFKESTIIPQNQPRWQLQCRQQASLFLMGLL